MIGKLSDQNQRDLFHPHLADFIDMNNELVLLTNKIEWDLLESELLGAYFLFGMRRMRRF